MINLPSNTVQPIAATHTSTALPEFGRVPDVQRLFGIKRGVLYRWIRERKVKSVNLRERGDFRGVRLICLDSVRCYIRAQLEQAEEEEESLAA